MFLFGGFFKRSWRANDILWGRLDGLCQIVETLFDRDRIRAVVDSDPLRAALAARIAPTGGDLHPKQLFPRADPDTQSELADWLAQLVSNRRKERDRALSEEHWGDRLDALVRAAQMEFLGDEIRNVIGDAVQEQMEWNFYDQRKDPYAPAAQSTQQGWRATFRQGKGRFDPTVHALAAAAVSKEAAAELREPSQVRGFFTKHYRVGAESVASDIPNWVMLELVFRMLLGARDCIAYALPASWHDKVKGSPAYRLLSGVLWLLYGMTSTLRSSTRMVLAIRSSLAATMILIWIVAVFWGQHIICADGEPNAWAFSLLLSPTVLLLFSFDYLRKWAFALFELGLAFLVAVKWRYRISSKCMW